ncbi:MAG: 2-oxoglutarate dehydrogenase E1 component, partial [bacterium]
STDVARMVQAPIFHVNGDDAEACTRAAQLAFDYRREFGKDVVIDMVCYRRHGHNEADDPSYTQPVMYRKIREHPSVTTIYAEQLVREGVLTNEDVEAMRKAYQRRLAEAFAAAQQHAEQYVVREVSPVSAEEAGAIRPYTAVDRGVLATITDALSRFPDDFHLHPKLRSFVERRKQAFSAGGPIDWAFAEALAFGSLVLEGTHVRLSGQDSRRGTFSQRHAVFSDYADGHEYCPLQHIAPNQARFEVYDSLLSEYAVLGFEFGYSLGDPLALVLWEAQFGDFANGAQIMIDQFLVGTEAKWGQPSGLVLLLPHGLEGQGPEHSSARVERFLQLAAGNNIQVVNPSTPAQYFHVLRRQMHGGRDRRGVRKPLIVLTPKSLLRHPRAVSLVDELASGSFREVIGETAPHAPESVRRVALCSGKLYYELLAAREQKKAHDIAIIRVEQLYPFPGAQVQEIIGQYPVTADVAWVQEEPWNMGAWRYVREQIQPLIAETRRVLRYIGRPESSSPATGLHRRHVEEQNAIIEAALRLG